MVVMRHVVFQSGWKFPFFHQEFTDVRVPATEDFDLLLVEGFTGRGGSFPQKFREIGKIAVHNEPADVVKKT